MLQKNSSAPRDRDASTIPPVPAAGGSAEPDRNRRPSFLERFLVCDAPADLDDVEAAIDAEPRSAWESLAPVAVLGFLIGFWGGLIWMLFF